MIFPKRDPATVNRNYRQDEQPHSYNQRSNDVMDSFDWVVMNRKGKQGRRPDLDSGVYMNINSGGRGDNHLVIRIYTPAMKKMRWVCGDKIQVGFDPIGMRVAMRRVPSGGYTASPAGSTKQDRKANLGKSASATVKLRLDDDVKFMFSNPSTVHVDKCEDVDGVLIIQVAQSEQ